MLSKGKILALLTAAQLLLSSCGPQLYTVRAIDYERGRTASAPEDMIGATTQDCTETAVRATRLGLYDAALPGDFILVEESPPGARLVGAGAGMLLVSLALVSIGSIIVTQADSGNDSFFEPFSRNSGWATIGAGGAAALSGATLITIGGRRRAEAPRMWVPEMTESFPCVEERERLLIEEARSR